MSWSAAEMSSLDLGDTRLDRRCALLLETLAQRPHQSISAASDAWADAVGAYRFFNNKRVTMEKILQAHSEATCQRIAKESVVLCLADTTQLDYTSMPETKGLGTLGLEFQNGLFLHPVLAVTPDRLCLGALDAYMWARPHDARVRKQRKKKGDSESYRWIHGYKQICATAHKMPQTQFVYVADRESDIAALFVEAQGQVVDVVVRARCDRFAEDDERLSHRIADAPLLGTTTFELPGTPKRASRTVTQEIRATTITLDASHYQLDQDKPVRMTVVMAQEINPPPGTESATWVLLTTKTVTTLKQAEIIISWYRCRWEIETFFHVLKTGCRVEQLQLTDADRLKPAIALYIIIASRILHATKISRVCPDIPATCFFTKQECDVVYQVVHRKNPPKEIQSLRTIVRLIARMGGFLARKSDGEPGPQTVWTGLIRLRDIIIGFNF